MATNKTRLVAWTSRGGACEGGPGACLEASRARRLAPTTISNPLTMADAASGSQDKSVQVKLVLLGAYHVWLGRGSVFWIYSLFWEESTLFSVYPLPSSSAAVFALG